MPASTPTCPSLRDDPCGDEIARLAAHLQRSREQERAALARELHDELGAILTAARLDVAWLAAQPCSQEPSVAARLAALQRVLQEGIELKRRIIDDLHPTILAHLGLAAALEHLVAELRGRFDGRLDADIDPSVSVSQEGGLAMYRVAQEALTNAIRHGRPTRLVVSLARGGRHAVLRIEDDGDGFDPARVGVSRHGLAGMRHRMMAVRGLLRLASEPGRGTSVTACVPVAAQQRRAKPAPQREAGPTPRRDPRSRVRPLHGGPPSPPHA